MRKEEEGSIHSPCLHTIQYGERGDRFLKCAVIKWSGILILAGILAVVSGGMLLQICFKPAAPAASWPEGERVWVVDPGHGGEDGGAVSITGEPESRLNLAVAQRLDALLGFYGENCYLMRQEDISLHDPEAETLREKKVSDLHNRVKIVQSFEEAVLVSIHQNMFSQSKYRGSQAFYAPTQGSQELAQAVQSAIQTHLQPDNSRQAKPIADTVYLMNHIDCTAVLVECGFLSNPEEEALLRQESYQTKIAAVIANVCFTQT